MARPRYATMITNHDSIITHLHFIIQGGTGPQGPPGPSGQTGAEVNSFYQNLCPVFSIMHLTAELQTHKPHLRKCNSQFYCSKNPSTFTVLAGKFSSIKELFQRLAKDMEQWPNKVKTAFDHNPPIA